MSYQLGSIDPDERAEEVGDPPGGRVRLLARGILSSALVLLVMAAFAGGVWFAHGAGKRYPGGGAEDVPLLRADPHPFKIRPATPGGMVVPDQNMLVYGERRNTVEHLLPPPEAPMPRPAPPAPKQAAVPPPAASAAAPGEPAPAPAQTPTAPAAKGLTTASALPGGTSTPAPPAAPTPPALANTTSVKTGNGGVRLQLGAVRSPDAARREWQHLKEANADLLGDVAGFAVRADLGAKGIYYRIETAPFADPAAATRLCGELKRRGTGCILGP
jgi:hypothetical protein